MLLYHHEFFTLVRFYHKTHVHAIEMTLLFGKNVASEKIRLPIFLIFVLKTSLKSL